MCVEDCVEYVSDRVLSGTRSASLCSYREGSYKAIFTVHRVFFLSQAALPMRARHLDLLAEGGRWLADEREVRTDRVTRWRCCLPAAAVHLPFLRP